MPNSAQQNQYHKDIRNNTKKAFELLAESTIPDSEEDQRTSKLFEALMLVGTNIAAAGVCVAERIDNQTDEFMAMDGIVKVQQGQISMLTASLESLIAKIFALGLQPSKEQIKELKVLAEAFKTEHQIDID